MSSGGAVLTADNITSSLVTVDRYSLSSLGLFAANTTTMARTTIVGSDGATLGVSPTTDMHLLTACDNAFDPFEATFNTSVEGPDEAAPVNSTFLNASCSVLPRPLCGALTALYGGTGVECLDCNGVSGGTNAYDACCSCSDAVYSFAPASDCGTTVASPDQCGVLCGQNDCLDCAMVPFGSAYVDGNSDCCTDDERDCFGVCSGNGVLDANDACCASDALDCGNVCNGPLVMDGSGGCCMNDIQDCFGVCSGNGVLDANDACCASDALDCGNVCNGPLVMDGSGGCCMNDIQDCFGVCSGNGVLDANDACCASDALDCGNVCNGPLVMDGSGGCCMNDIQDCFGVCSGNGVLDANDACCASDALDCGNVCNGPLVMDGSGGCCMNDIQDCFGVCSGNGVLDANDACCASDALDCGNVCNGPLVMDGSGGCCMNDIQDCFGVCSGNGVLDANDACCASDALDCGNVCNGARIVDGNGDCCTDDERDCFGICSGSGTLDVNGTCCTPEARDCGNVCEGTRVGDGSGGCCMNDDLDCFSICFGSAISYDTVCCLDTDDACIDEALVTIEPAVEDDSDTFFSIGVIAALVGSGFVLAWFVWWQWRRSPPHLENASAPFVAESNMSGQSLNSVYCGPQALGEKTLPVENVNSTQRDPDVEMESLPTGAVEFPAESIKLGREEWHVDGGTADMVRSAWYRRALSRVIHFVSGSKSVIGMQDAAASHRDLKQSVGDEKTTDHDDDCRDSDYGTLATLPDDEQVTQSFSAEEHGGIDTFASTLPGSSQFESSIQDHLEVSPNESTM